jgi:predicted nucleic acid-binding protein
MTVFLDTSFFIASLAPRDQWRHVALAAPIPGLPVTTSLIVNETVGLLQSRGFLSMALDFLQRVHSGEIEIVYPDAELQSAGWVLLWSHGGSGANAVDCTSFALMKQRRIRVAYTFDDHFRHAGFETLLTSK